MRISAFILVVLALAACSPQAGGADRCGRAASHDVTWSDSEAADTVTATAEGPNCAQAVVTFVVRAASGAPLWAFASTYDAMTARTPGEAVAPGVMDNFLKGWVDISEMRTSQLPLWREDATTLTESAETFAYDTPFDRETYERLRALDLSMLCFAVTAESVECVIMDPASKEPGRMVTYGP